MWTALPSSEYYGASAPSRRHQPTVGLAALPRWVRGRVRRHRDGSHVHRQPIGGGGVQLYPCSIAPGYRSPPRSLGMRDSKPHTEMGANSKGAPSAAHGPDPSGFEPPTCQGASTTGSVSLHLPASLAGPGRLMVPTRPYFVTAAPARSPHLRGRAAVSFSRPLQWPGAGLQPARSIGASWRTGVDVERDGLRTRPGSRGERPAEELPADLIELAGVAEGEAPEERPQGGGSPQLVAEHRLGSPGSQGVAIVDGVAAGQQGVNDGHGLVPDVRPSGRRPQVEDRVEQLLQPEVLREGGGQQQAGICHQMIVVETDVEPVQGVR